VTSWDAGHLRRASCPAQSGYSHARFAIHSPGNADEIADKP